MLRNGIDHRRWLDAALSRGILGHFRDGQNGPDAGKTDADHPLDDIHHSFLHFSAHFFHLRACLARLLCQLPAQLCEAGLNAGIEVGKARIDFCLAGGKLGIHFLAVRSVIRLSLGVFADLSNLVRDDRRCIFRACCFSFCHPERHRFYIEVVRMDDQLDASAGETDGGPDSAPPVVPEDYCALCKVRPRLNVQHIIAGLGRNDTALKRQLRKAGMQLKRERLPDGDCWVIARRCFDCRCQWQLKQDISDALEPGTYPRICVGRSAFWRIAALALWNAGRIDELRRRLPGVLELYIPQAYLVWARLLVRDGRGLEAGMYFLLSGLYDDSESAIVERYKRTLARAHPNVLVGRMPGPCVKRKARRAFPPKVLDDLATVPCPDWLKRRPAHDS